MTGSLSGRRAHITGFQARSGRAQVDTSLRLWIRADEGTELSVNQIITLRPPDATEVLGTSRAFGHFDPHNYRRCECTHRLNGETGTEVK